MSYICARTAPVLALLTVVSLGSGCGASFKDVARASIGALGDSIDTGWTVESSRQKAQQRAVVARFYVDEAMTVPREGVTQEDVFEALEPVRERHQDIREAFRSAIHDHGLLVAAFNAFGDGEGTMAQIMELLAQARAAYAAARDAVASDPDDPPDEGGPDEPEEE